MNPKPGSNAPSQQEAAKHAGYVVEMAKRLADGKRPGVLATVDERGMPHLRWMATLSLHDWPLLHTITSPSSAKVAHIAKNPCVSWMFSNEELNIIVNIRGKARLVEESATRQRVWKFLEDKSKAYFLSIASDGLGFAILETEIEDIDCIVPRYDFRFQAKAADWMAGVKPVGE